MDNFKFVFNKYIHDKIIYTYQLLYNISFIYNTLYEH